MAEGFESSVRVTLSPLESDEAGEPREFDWTFIMRNGPLKSDPLGFDHEVTLNITRADTGETIEFALDGNASTWDTFRHLAESGIPELAALFSGQRMMMID